MSCVQRHLQQSQAQQQEVGLKSNNKIMDKQSKCHQDGLRSLKIISLRFPWWLSRWEFTCQCRRHRFDPWSEKIPRAAEQLSQCTTTTTPASCNRCSLRILSCALQLLKPWQPRAHASQEKPPRWEAHASQLESRHSFHNQKKPVQSNEDPEQPKIK